MEAWIAFFTLLIAQLMTVLGWLREHRLKKAEEALRTRAEKELKEIRARAEAPFLNAVRLVAKGVAIAGEGKTFDDLVDGEDLAISLSNTGKHARLVTDDWRDGTGISAKNGEIAEGVDDMAWLIYKFKAAEKGKRQKIAISFEVGGVKGTHIYETMHGHCYFKRIDPA